MSPINNEEAEVFEALVSGRYDNFALARTELDGEEVAVIVAITEDDEQFNVAPLAVLVTDELFSRLKDPALAL